VSGSADRHKDVPAGVRASIARWAVREIQGSTFPLADRYPDVVKIAQSQT